MPVTETATPAAKTQTAALDALAEAGSRDEFVIAAMRHLPSLVQSDVTAYNEVDITARRIRTIIDDPHTERVYLDNPRRLDQKLVAQNPLISYHATPGKPARRISDFIDLDQWHSTDLHQSFFGRSGLSYQTAMVLPLGDPRLVAFTFNRRDIDFSDADLATIDHLVPHVARLYRIAEDRGIEAAKKQNREAMLRDSGSHWVDVGADGAILEASPGVLALIDRFHPLRRSADTALPHAVEDWLAASLAPDADQAPLIASDAEGVLEITLFATVPDGPVSLMVVHRSLSHSAETLQSLGLSARQAETLYWLAQGKSNGDIAIILRISPRTVDSHVYSIFEALGASNRIEAALTAHKVLAKSAG